MPKITVIIPSFNHEKYIAQTIQSVLDQTYQDFEIVIADDGSTDETVSVIRGFTDPRIRLFCFKQNQGACVAANKCISKAKGEFIAMLSSDDIFNYDKLEKQVSFLDLNSEVGAVFSYARIIDEDGNDFVGDSHFYKRIFIQHNRTRFEWLNYFFFKGNCLCHPSALIRKQCYNQVGHYDERLAQLPDLDFWIRLCTKYEIYIIPENLIKFRVRKNEANASGNRPEVKVRLEFELIQVLKNYLKPEIRNNLSKIFQFTNSSEIVGEGERIELSPFLIAMFALRVNNPSYKHFAINILFEIIGDKSIMQKVRDKYHFNFIDLIKLTGNLDSYNIIDLEHMPSHSQLNGSESEKSIFTINIDSQSRKHQTEQKEVLTVKYPVILPVTGGSHRPFWSVMIPTYNPNHSYLEKALRSVLALDPGADEMQIEVVDDCSTQDDSEAIIKEIGEGRIQFYRQPKNVGLATNWNTCIQRAHGHWVHILHQDDIVLPGFYSRLREATEQEPTVGALFCRYINIDENDRWQSLGPLEKEAPGILSGFLEQRLAIFNPLRTPGVVVERNIYQQLGGFLPELTYAVDWEMWKRIVARYPSWYEPQPLVCYRYHFSSETSRLMRSGANVVDLRRAIELSESYLPKTIATELSSKAREYCALDALNEARQMLYRLDMSAAIAQIREGLKCSNSYGVISSFASLLKESEPLLRLLASVFLSTDPDQFLPLISQNHEPDIQFEFELGEINLVIFPNWEQSEEDLYQDLASVITNILTHPDKSRMKLWIDNSDISDEDANNIISDVVFNLVVQEDLDVTEEPAISLIGKLSEMQWKLLLQQIQVHIVLNNENKGAITKVGAENIPSFALEELEAQIGAKSTKPIETALA